MIGDCGITMQQVENELLPEIGYHLRKEFRSKDYATEAAKSCAEFAKKKGIKKIIEYLLKILFIFIFKRCILFL